MKFLVEIPGSVGGSVAASVLHGAPGDAKAGIRAYIFDTNGAAIEGLSQFEGPYAAEAHVKLRNLLAMYKVIPCAGDVELAMLAAGRDLAADEAWHMWDSLCGDSNALLRVVNASSMAEVIYAEVVRIEDSRNDGSDATGGRYARFQKLLTSAIEHSSAGNEAQARAIAHQAGSFGFRLPISVAVSSAFILLQPDFYRGKAEAEKSRLPERDSVSTKGNPMFFVVEIPHQRPASAVAFRNDEDFVNRVTAAHVASRSGSVLWEQTTPRALADNFGEEDLPEEVKRIAEESGWEVPLYRSDFISSSGQYQTDTISEKEACKAFLAHDLHALHIYETSEDAIRGLNSYSGHQAGAAYTVLRRVLADEGVIPNSEDVLNALQEAGADPDMSEVESVWRRLCSDTAALLRVTGVETCNELSPAIRKEIARFAEMDSDLSRVDDKTASLLKAAMEHYAEGRKDDAENLVYEAGRYGAQVPGFIAKDDFLKTAFDRGAVDVSVDAAAQRRADGIASTSPDGP